MWVGAYLKGGLLNLQVLGSVKHSVLYYFCTLELLSPKDLAHIKQILNVEKRRGPQIPIRMAKEYQSLQELVEKKQLRNILN